MLNSYVVCPACGDHRLILKYEATYEYSYILDGNAPGLSNISQLRPYCYDNRQQKDARQSIECQTCGAVFSCYFDQWQNGIDAKDVQEALDTAYEAQQRS